MLKNLKILFMLCFAFSLYGQDDHLTKQQAMEYVESTIKQLIGIEEEEITNELVRFVKTIKYHLSNACARYSHWYSITPYYLQKNLYDGVLAALVNDIEDKISLYTLEEIVAITSDRSIYEGVINAVIKNIKNEFLAMLVKANDNGLNGFFGPYTGRALRNKIIDALIEEIKRLQPQDGKEIVYAMLECPLCMDEFEPKNGPKLEKKVLDCYHYFCKDCLIKWQNAKGVPLTCPTCRKEVSTQWINDHLRRNVDIQG